MTTHTPEPWKVDSDLIVPNVISKKDLNVIAEIHCIRSKDGRANAARIVACINGCAGLNPDSFRQCVTLLQECLIPLETDLMDIADRTDKLKLATRIREALTASQQEAEQPYLLRDR